MKYLALLLFSVMMTSLTEARSSVGKVILTAKLQVVVQGETEEIRINCRSSLTVNNVLMAVVIHLEKIDENGTTSLVASKRFNSLVLADNNRTTADAYLQEERSDRPSSLNVTIKDPIMEDDGTYHCIFLFIDTSYAAYSIGSKLNVTVLELPQTEYSSPGECGCGDIRAEINQLKATLAIRNEQPRQPDSPYNGTCRSSFSARFATKHGYAIITDETAIFDDVISNKGDSYDPLTGIFKAPCDGQYFFTVSLRSHQTKDLGSVEGVIVVDEQPRARTSVFLDDTVDNYQSASNGVVLSLKAGQEVKVVVKTTSSGEFVGEEYSIFSGFFLFP